jgi:AcrR family transcriptional regulator
VRVVSHGAVTSDTPPALRERKKAATRLALREAALELCARDGYVGLTVDAICLRANVSRRTFSNYFADRDDAIICWSSEDHAALASVIVARPADEDPMTAVEAALSDFVDAAATTALWRAQIALLVRYPVLRERFSALSRRMESSVAEAVSARTGCAVDDIAVTMLTAAMLAATRTALMRWFTTPAVDVRQLLHTHVEVLRAGCGVNVFALQGNTQGMARF